jgi:hypothetical protein
VDEVAGGDVEEAPELVAGEPHSHGRHLILLVGSPVLR